MNHRIAVPGALAPLLVALFVTAGSLSAQEQEARETSAEMAAAMEAYEEAGTPGEPHEALARTAGTWNVSVKMWMEPDAEPTVTEATATIEPIMGGRFVRETVEGEFMGRPFHGISIVGVNNVTGEAEAVWYDNHSTTLYTYRGSIDETGGEIRLEGTFTDPVTGERVETRTRRTIRGDEMVETGWETRDGRERKSMELVYRRDG